MTHATFILTGDSFTVDKLRTIQKRLADLAPAIPLTILVSEHALKDSDIRLFPESRHRSRRIHKKLVKRHGGVFRKVPCIFKTPESIIMHPTLYREFQAEMARQVNERHEKAFLGALFGGSDL